MFPYKDYKKQGVWPLILGTSKFTLSYICNRVYYQITSHYVRFKWAVLFILWTDPSRDLA